RAVVAKATIAKARRDATFQVVPGALCKSLEEAARKTAIGTEATLGKRRATLLDWINKLGVEPRRVWAALGVAGIDDIGLEELEVLTGIKTAIKDGDVSAEDAFPSGSGPDHVDGPLDEARKDAAALGILVDDGATARDIRKAIKAEQDKGKTSKMGKGKPKRNNDDIARAARKVVEQKPAPEPEPEASADDLDAVLTYVCEAEERLPAGPVHRGRAAVGLTDDDDVTGASEDILRALKSLYEQEG
ncbi:MAG: hypothetical protein ABIG68_05235, partial [Acidobacteriota bacterium]